MPKKRGLKTLYTEFNRQLYGGRMEEQFSAILES